MHTISRLEAQTWTLRFALLGSILTIVALVFRGIGIYRMSIAVHQMRFGQMDDLKAVSAALATVTSDLGKAGDMLLLGNAVLLVGGGLITYALVGGRFRRRWFFWFALAFSLLLFWQPIPGTVFGLWWLWHLFRYRSEFFAKQAILIAA